MLNGGELMINGVIDGVCEALKAEFEGVAIYTEAVPQNLKLPAFFVYAAEGTRTYRFRGKRHKAEIKIGIEYFTAEKNENAEVSVVLERLCGCTEFIVADGKKRRGRNAKTDTRRYDTGRKNENNKKTLVFIVDYEFFFIIDEKTELMEDLELMQKLE